MMRSPHAPRSGERHTIDNNRNGRKQSMFKVISKQVNAATVIAVVALVFAMTGGAFALSGGGNSGSRSASSAGGAGGTHTTASIATTKKKKASSKGAAGRRGPKGETGPAGPTGPAGSIGPVGSAGAVGPIGPVGPAGPAGDKGTTGAKGATGSTGETGSPWTAGGTLPDGATETGAFVASGIPAETFLGYTLTASVSFTLPVAEKLTAIHVISKGESLPTGCTGSPSKPAAEAGYLCIYISFATATVDPSKYAALETGNSGAAVFIEPDEIEEPPGSGTMVPNKSSMLAFGTWAVTGN
jgi:hypothetical protein